MNQPGMKEKLGYTAAAIGQSLAGGDGLGMIQQEQERRRRLADVAQQRSLENERYMRGYMENKLARLAQDKRYEEGIARAGQYRAEDLARADIEGMNRRNDAALGTEREERRDAERLAREAQRDELAQIAEMNRANTSLAEFGLREQEAKRAQDRYQNIEIPESAARIEKLETPPYYRGQAMSPAFGAKPDKPQTLDDVRSTDPQGFTAALQAVRTKYAGQPFNEQVFWAEYLKMKGLAGGASAPTNTVPSDYKQRAIGAPQ